MSEQKLLEKIRVAYSQCQSYRDKGFLQWDLSGHTGTVSFETYFLRPSEFCFIWRGSMYSERGDNYDASRHTVIGMQGGKAFSYDPGFKDSKGICPEKSLQTAILNDSVYSAGIAKIVAPLLMPSAFSGSAIFSDRTFELEEGPESHMDSSLLLKSIGTSRRFELTVDSHEYLIKQLTSLWKPVNDREELMSHKIAFEISESAVHREVIEFTEAAFNTTLDPALFDPEVIAGKY